MPESKPKINDLQKGITGCPSCSFKLNLDKFEPLEVVACTACGTPLFIPQKIKHYWLYRPLGGGGMGCVYRALSEENPGEFAVKILPRNRKDDQVLITTLMMEGKIGKILGKSPHIVEVIEYGVDEDEHFMVSRFVEGTRLDIFISSASRLSERQALDIMVQVINAEIHIRNCGYLFRDMKPENIIILEETSSVKLFDFGLCISLEHAANPNPDDHLEGSPYYLPPERIVAAPEGEYSEVYSLGMLLFHMLTGTTYFSQADIKDLVTKHVRALGVNSVKQRLEHCSPQIIHIIEKMIQSDPNKRYHTLDEVLQRIKEFSKVAPGYPLSQTPEKVKEKKFTKDRENPRQSFSTLNSIIIILLSGVILYEGWIFWQQEKAERKYNSVLTSTAEELKIPADIPPPLLTKNEVREIISKQVTEKFQEQALKLKTFDKNSVIVKICREKSLMPDRLNKPYISIKKIKEAIKQELNKQIEKELNLIKREFSKERAEKEVAADMNTQLPVAKPIKTVEELKKEALTQSTNVAGNRYPIKKLSVLNMNILKKYRCYKVGERVAISSLSGEKIKGIYQGIIKGKIVIGGKAVTSEDLPESISIKFDSPRANKKIHTEIKRVTTQFTAEKLKYQKSLYTLILKKLYTTNGYFYFQNRWMPAIDVFNELMLQKKKNFNNLNLNREEIIIKFVKKRFDYDKFYKRAGYVKLKGRWLTGKEFVERLVRIKKDEFEKEQSIKLKRLNKEIKNDIEQKLFLSNGYIFRNNQWIPAVQVLHNAVEEKMNK
jgi:serine/threonine-protein kinase